MLQVLEIANEFTNEVGYNFDPVAAHETILAYHDSPQADVLLVHDGDVVSGGALVLYESAFHYERCGVVVKFYVRKDYRKTETGRRLAKKVSEWFDSNHCVFSEIIVTGNLQTDKLTLNLFKKFGYTNQSVSLRRYYNGSN